jgi:hydrogenase maturation protease
MSSPAEGVLVIGYGNPLRSDDGFGPCVAERLAGDDRLAGAQVVARHQLTPELADDMARARFVVFVDARVDAGPPGRIRVERLAPDDATRSSSHHVDPAGLLALSEQVYGRAPAAALVSVSAGSVEIGERLTPAVAGAVAAAVETVVAIVVR